MTAELAARVSSSAEYGGVEAEYVDPGPGAGAEATPTSPGAQPAAHSASHCIAP